MTDDADAVRHRIESIVASVTGKPAVADAPWESLAHVEILFTVEEAYDLEFDEDTMARATSVDALTTEVVRLLAS